MSDQPPGEAVEIVASVGALDGTVALLRDFLHRSGALRAVAVVDRGPADGPAVVDCERFAPVEVDLGERIVQLPHEAELGADAPGAPDVRPLPPFDVDPERGEVTGTIGGLDHLMGAVGELADLLGGQNVAMAVFETTDPDRPLALTARAGGREPVVIAFGDEMFER